MVSKIDAINNALFEVDPMNTSAKENNLTDEYSTLANGIVELLDRGISLKAAIKVEFDYAFWNECLNEETIDKIIKLVA